MGLEILVPLGFFAFLAAIIVLPQYFRSKDRERMMQTLQTAYEKGTPIPPELVATLQDRNAHLRAPDADLRRAIILISVALGLVALGYGLNWTDGFEGAAPTMAAGAIPGFIGLGYLALWFFTRKTPRT